MTSTARTLRYAMLTFLTIMLVAGAVAGARAADMPGPRADVQSVPAMPAADYLGCSADLMMLRLRFGAVLEDEVRDAMHAAALSLENGAPKPESVRALDRDLTAELSYYTVNLKYLIMAEDAIWPKDRPARTYRNDALSALGEIADELAAGDVLALDIDALLARLEQVNAWTEGLAAPEADWFDPLVRQRLVEDALKAASETARI